jgi:hypothetical protein
MPTATTPDVFISYAREDRPFANFLKGFLLARDHSVWSDDDIAPGDEWADAITRAVEDSRIVLLLLSPGYVESRSALYEAGMALAKQRDRKGKVIPILLGDVEPAKLPLPLRDTNLLDLRRLGQKELLGKLDHMLTD